MLFTDMEKMKAYKVTKGNSDGSIEKGEILYLDNERNLVAGFGGFFTNDELTDSITDFEVKASNEFIVDKWGSSEGLRRRKDVEAILGINQEDSGSTENNV